MPLNVSLPNTGCVSAFNLAPAGQAGDSCTLYLTVKGPVNGGDRDPKHHLLVCFPGGLTCNGPDTPLNIELTSLKSITLAPVNPSTPKGNMQQFTATGHFSDGHTENISARVTWKSSNPSVASISNTGLASTNSVGTSIITASFGAITSAPDTFTVLPAVVVSFAITPTTAASPKGSTQQFTATGTYSDGTTQNITNLVTWNSSNTTVSQINSSGLASALTIGVSNISATYSGLTSNAVVFTVQAAALVSIGITPLTATINQGQIQQYIATGTYTDNSTQNITTSVLWHSSNTTAAVIDSYGSATALVPTDLTPVPIITASRGAITSNTATLNINPIVVSIAVTPVSPSVPAGLTQQLTATAIYSDGTTQDVTSTATWHTSNTLIAKINSSGLLTAVSVGTANITATSSSMTSPIDVVTVAPPLLYSISITPQGSSSIPQNTTQQYTAIGTYSDSTSRNITTSVTWNSSNLTTVTINANGLATGIAPTDINPPVADITASLSSIMSNTASLTVTPIIVSIAVTPTSPSIALGLKQQFTAIATLTDGSTPDVTSTATWNSSNTAVATINSAGLASTLSQGSTNISATQSSVTSNLAALTVGPATLVTITLSPASAVTLSVGQTQAYTATGTYTDNTTQDLTSLATFASSNTNAAVLTTTATYQALGFPTNTNITASYQSVTSLPSSMSITGMIYITTNQGVILACPVNSDSTLGTCASTPASVTGSITYAGGTSQIASNTIYAAAFNAGNSTFNNCSVNSDGSLGSCHTTGSFGGVYISSASAFGHTALYASLNGGPNVGINICTIGTGNDISSCSVDPTFTTSSEALAPFAAQNFFAYIVSPASANIIALCTINGSDGTLSNCSNNSSISGALLVAVDQANARAYFDNGFQINVCTLDTVTGVFSSCQTTTNPATHPQSLVVPYGGYYLYIVDQYNSFTQSRVFACPINGDGTLGTCNSVKDNQPSETFLGLTAASQAY